MFGDPLSNKQITEKRSFSYKFYKIASPCVHVVRALQGGRRGPGSTGVLDRVTNRLVCLGQGGSQDMGLSVLKPGKFWQTQGKLVLNAQAPLARR